jgi:4-hydroxythreonine-4-phosphate dehydrogenase
MKTYKIRVAITMGDPAGSGPELLLKALRHVNYNTANYIVIGDYKVLQNALNIIGHQDLKLLKINDITQFSDKPNVINVYDLDNVDPNRLIYGRPSAMGGKASYEYIIESVKFALKKLIDAVVTMPISKESLNMAGYNYPGHTELLADLTGAKDVRMMLVAKHLRVVHVTTHISLRRMLDLIKKDRIFKTIELTNNYLKEYFNIPQPKIAVAGLNPHAGEGGLFGDEEKTEITPAIEEAKQRDIITMGPYPPDTIFYRTYYNREFDAVIAMYHDQGHIPIKMIGFMEGINITLGLPIIRISPDHGTVWDKAGKGTADETATLEAIKYAIILAKNKNR